MCNFAHRCTRSEIIISQIKNELRADSRTFAPKLGIRHRQLMDNIRKYEAQFLELGRVPFETETIETAGGPQQSVYALLNEDQAYFLLTQIERVGQGGGALPHHPCAATQAAYSDLRRVHSPRQLRLSGALQSCPLLKRHLRMLSHAAS